MAALLGIEEGGGDGGVGEGGGGERLRGVVGRSSGPPRPSGTVGLGGPEFRITSVRCTNGEMFKYIINFYAIE